MPITPDDDNQKTSEKTKIKAEKVLITIAVITIAVIVLFLVISFAVNGSSSSKRQILINSTADKMFTSGTGWITNVDGGNANVKRNTSAKITFDSEVIQSRDTDVMILQVNLASGTEWRIGEFMLEGNRFIEQFKKANGVKFSVMGDGEGGWRIMFPIRETRSDKCWHEAVFSTVNGRITHVDIQFSKLKQPDWGRKVAFNRENITSFVIQRHSTEKNYSGSSTIKIFNLDVY